MAASILVYRENNIVGVVALLKRSCDYTRIRAKVWYAWLASQRRPNCPRPATVALDAIAPAMVIL